MKKPTKIVLSVVGAVLLVAMGVAGWVIAYKFNNPEWFENAKKTAFTYIENNAELQSEYGEGFNYRMSKYDSEFSKKEGTGNFNAVFKIGNDKYEINLICTDNEWSVVDFKKK